MSGINLSRVILGGLVAGVVLNIGETIFNAVLFAEANEAAFKALNLPPIGGRAVAWFVIAGFIFSIVMVWLYAAIRPRLGAGPKTAVCAGLTAWTFGYLFPGIGFLAMGLFPSNLMIYGLVWSLFEVAIAAVAGAYFYREA
ncbi:MAG TPA: hypothetical protein VJ180_03910 [Pyrinomonadaceae bacterium]|nr:hypothetical protein [Pyrinomonadaceae bacterium]